MTLWWSLCGPGLYDVLEFVHKHQATEERRDNNKEFLELSVVFLGDVPVRGIRFQKPGGMQRTQCIVQVIDRGVVVVEWLRSRPLDCEVRGSSLEKGRNLNTKISAL